MKNLPVLCVVLCVLLFPPPASSGLLSAGGIFIKDTNGVNRGQFSNNERISLTARLNNATASANRISFTFKITAPTGERVFLHTGNSVPGSVGNSASQVSGVPISKFFNGPGVYTFSADAVLDGQTVSQSAVFTVSSPNIILVYPPTGARSVADRPLTFRWSSSGAAKYRVTVGDNAALYNAVFVAATAGAENFLAYPDNPSDSRARLAAGQVYYWKVEGLDAAGNAIAQSEVPFNFTAQTAALTRDMAVLSLEATGRSGNSVDFKVRLANQGGTTESNVPLRFSVGGIPAPGTPLALPQLSPGDVREYPFTAALPPDQGQSLAIACVEFFDDNVPNNCKSIQVTRAAAAGDSGFGPSAPLTKEQLTAALAQKLAELGLNAAEYGIGDVTGLSSEDLSALLNQLSNGTAQVSVSGPPPGAFTPPAAGSAPPAGDAAGLPPPTPGLAGGPTGPDVNSGPEVAPPSAGGAGNAAVGTGEAWKDLSPFFQRSGFDPGQYNMGSMVPPLSGDDMAALLDQMANGQAQMTVSGPPPGADAGLPPPPTPGVSGGPQGPDVNAGPEVAPPEAAAAGAQPAKKGAVQEDVGRALRGIGLDPGQFDVTGSEPPLSADDAAALAKALVDGGAQVTLSGPPPAPEPADLPPPTAAPVSGPKGPDVNAAPEVAPPEAPPADEVAPTTAPPAGMQEPAAAAPTSEVGREFAGIAITSFGDAGMRTLLRDKKSFGRVWKRLSNGDAPELDFKQYMVVAIVAGDKDDSSRIEVEDVMEALTGLVVRYRAVPREPALGLPGAPARSGAAYMLKVIRASGLEADFQQVGKEGR